jgi:hypothetical protein
MTATVDPKADNKISAPKAIFTFAMLAVGVAFMIFQIVSIFSHGPNFWNVTFLVLSVFPLFHAKYKNHPIRHLFKVLDTLFEILVIGYSVNALLFNHGGFWDVVFLIAFATTFIISAKRGFSEDALNDFVKGTK